MRSYTRTSPPIGLLAIFSGFLVLVTLLIVFSRELFRGVQELVSPPASVIAIVAVLVLALILVGLIVLQAIRLLRDRARRRPGAFLKTRFILFITTLVLAATAPLEIVSFNFIDIASSFWLGEGIEESIQSATNLAFDYRDTTVRNLETFAGSGLMTTYLSRGASASEWRAVAEASPFVDLIQVFDGSGREISFRSSDEDLATEFRLSTLDELKGRPPRETVDRRSGKSLIRHWFTRTLGTTVYHVAVGTLLSPGFTQTSGRLGNAANVLASLHQFSQRTSVVVLGLYLLFSLPIVLLCLLVSFYLADELVLPILSLEDAIRRVAQGDFSFRILVRSRDELSVLVNSFNRMVTELGDSRQKLLQAEKIAAWKEIARRLAHELKNPLTPIKLSAQRILRRAQGEHTAAELESVVSGSVPAIIREVDLLDGLLREFSDFARLPEPRRVSLRLAEVVEQAVAVYAPSAPAVTFDLEGLPADLTLSADAEQLRRALSNLLANALHALPQGGSVTILADVVRKGETDYCRIQVRDTGMGMDDETRRNALVPYFTTRKEGTGLGLAIVERIVFDHNGQIWIESHPGVGTTVYIDLPLV